jgi:tRNA dimethylallyltransferase
LKTLTKHLIVITGPTAVGKTAMAITVAKQLQTEIISADSRQFFRELTIGTAKPTAAELQQVPHHFINSHSIAEVYDAARFAGDALAVAARIFNHHHYAVLCGGSGLYIKAVCEGFDDIPPVPGEIRQQLVQQFNTHGVAWLQQQMRELDPDHFQTLDIRNPHRLIRALEVKIGTGISIAGFRNKKKRQHNFNIIKIGLELPREELYRRIDERMDSMVAAGLFEEAAQLYPYRQHNALQTVGYQEIFGFLEGQYDRDETIRLLKRNSRRYAKRQLTWFKRDPDIRWFEAGPEAVQQVMEYINRSEM